ncbi:MAG: KTSC domain-containing protein [Polyangiaceae bacterium]
MKREALASKMMISAGYDSETRTLEIEFARGRVYEYYDVPRAIFDHLVKADSKGKFFATWIEGRYKFIELD